MGDNIWNISYFPKAKQRKEKGELQLDQLYDPREWARYQPYRSTAKQARVIVLWARMDERYPANTQSTHDIGKEKLQSQTLWPNKLGLKLNNPATLGLLIWYCPGDTELTLISRSLEFQNWKELRKHMDQIRHEWPYTDSKDSSKK